MVYMKMHLQRVERKIVEKIEAHILCPVLSFQKLNGFRGTQTDVSERARILVLCIHFLTYLILLDLIFVIIVM
jgi:hypothetical protein